MAAIRIEIRGLDRLLERFNEIIDGLAGELDAAVQSGAQLVEDSAVTLVPVRTGNLKSTIHTEPGDRKLQYIVKAGGPQAPYAPYVEYGTYKMGAQPYMRPSADARRAEIVALIRKTIAGILEAR